jgi:competence protein ComEA
MEIPRLPQNFPSDCGNPEYFDLSAWWQKWRWSAAAGGGSLICIIVSVILIVRTVQTPDEIRFSSGSTQVLGDQSNITVDIEGGVAKPGVYKLAQNSRIDDAITVAGGLSPDCDTGLLAKTVNRAKGVEDGAKIWIPVLSPDNTSHNNGFATSASNNAVSQNQGTVVATSQTSSQNGANNGSTLISINSATEAELDSLPGVGPVTAQKIINNRPYSDPNELVSKKAVGQAVFTKIKDLISL